MDRRDFIASLGGGLAGILAGGSSASEKNWVKSVAGDKTIEKPLEHLPRKLEELLALSDEQKILLSAATASGCDAIAYYTPDASGTLALKSHIDLYPDSNTAFAPTAAYNPHTFDTEEHARNNATYHIPVPSTGGLIVLHAPQNAYSRVQNEAEAADQKDAHEQARFRKAKLEMAEHIVRAHEDLFAIEPDSWAERFSREAKAEHHKTLPEKLAYFRTLIEDMKKTLGDESFQISHFTGVADMMTATVDKAINTPGKDIVNPAQRELLNLIAQLHDVGKTQLSSAMLMPWRSGNKGTQEENEYSTSINHNHPLFTLTTMLLYEQEGLETAAHHHGLFRYTDEELKRSIGDKGYQHYHILTDNIPFDKLPPLSKIMRVCDVGEAIMRRSHKSVDETIRIMAEKAGYDAATNSFKPVTQDANTIAPDYLCFMVANGVFDEFAKNHADSVKNDPEKTEQVKKAILDAFHYDEQKATLEPKLRDAIANDKLLTQNTGLSRSR